MTPHLPDIQTMHPDRLAVLIDQSPDVYPGCSLLVRNGERSLLNPVISTAQLLAALDFDEWNPSWKQARTASRYTHYAVIADPREIIEHYWPHTRRRALSALAGCELLILSPRWHGPECLDRIRGRLIVASAQRDVDRQTPYSIRELVYYLKWSWKGLRRFTPFVPGVPFWTLFRSASGNVCSGQGVLWHRGAAAVLPENEPPEAWYPARYIIDCWTPRPRFRIAKHIKLAV